MYKKSHILGLLDINTMKVSDLFGNFPPVYSGKSIPQYSNFSYTFHQDTIYTSFAADPLIHVYKYPDKYLYSFGYECTGIDRSYTVTDSFLDNEVYKDYERCGSNQEFFYFPDLGLFFRKYWTGIKLNKSGLQIYDREYNLIGDIIVPETFQLLGYYTPYFYGVSAIPIETENETWITFYKLNINFLD
jgi:hypothetical protein